MKNKNQLDFERLWITARIEECRETLVKRRESASDIEKYRYKIVKDMDK
tara:strand:- start:293 stop:439 length:147 start_codon:yes stop_codon:yes gene_type:complete